MQRRVTIFVGDVQVGTFAHQQLDNLNVLSFDSQMQRRLEIHILSIQIRFSHIDQQLGNVNMIVECSKVERCVAVVFLLLDNPRSVDFR